MDLSHTEPLVSVMIPYYNCKPYIAETLTSVAAQTYPNIEIIIIDDGSSPEHSDYLQNLLADKPHIHYAHQQNQGVSAARNHAARLASGAYFLFIDADDVILPEYIAKAIAVLQDNPDCKLVYPQAEFFDAQSGLWGLPQYESLQKLLEGNHIPIIALHRAEDFHRIGGFDKTLHSHEDWDLWIRMLEHGGYAQLINSILFCYRRRQDNSSLTNKLINEKQAAEASWQKVYIKHSELFMRQGLGYHNLIHELKRNRHLSIFSRLKGCLKKLMD